MFADRIDAGRRLAAALEAWKGDASAIVLGIPRGGVVVAAEVARALELPLDVVVAAKVGAPGNPEYAIGAVAPDGQVVANPESGYSSDTVQELSSAAHALVERRLKQLREGLGPFSVEGRTAIVVDDGLATGLTAIAAVDYLKRAGAARVVLAVPVAPPSAVRRLSRHADEVVALQTPAFFSAVGQFYERFGQTDDAEVIALLQALA